jgi:hypothetical protein
VSYFELAWAIWEGCKGNHAMKSQTVGKEAKEAAISPVGGIPEPAECPPEPEPLSTEPEFVAELDRVFAPLPTDPELLAEIDRVFALPPPYLEPYDPPAEPTKPCEPGRFPPTFPMLNCPLPDGAQGPRDVRRGDKWLPWHFDEEEQP